MFIFSISFTDALPIDHSQFFLMYFDSFSLFNFVKLFESFNNFLFIDLFNISKKVDRYIAEQGYVIPLFQYVQPIIHRKGLEMTPHQANFVLPHLMKNK